MSDFQTCCCCGALARYDVGSSPCCGRHLATMVRFEAGSGGGSCPVTLRTPEELREARRERAR